MSIPMNKYVDIKSKVGATGGVQRRELILRLFTKSELVAPATPLEFSNADDVGTLFGLESDEYLRAVAYFDYVAPDYSKPKKISFGSDSQTKGAPQVIGSDPKSVADIVATGATSFGVSTSVNGASYNNYLVENLKLTGLTTYAQIASAMQTAMRARFSTNALASLKNATVTYDTANQRFVFQGTAGEAVTISFETNPSEFTVATGLYGKPNGGWATVVSGSVAAASPTQSVEESIDASNNFGTFTFIRTLTLDEHVAIAKANADRNVAFEYVVPVTQANYQTWSAALLGYEGTTLVMVADTNTEFDELMPASIKAAVDYEKADSVVAYMYKQREGLSAKVSDLTLSNALDKARVNYYGQTQQAGQIMAFYQRGKMMGGKTAPVDENVFANEQWLKDDLAAGFMELFLSVGRVSNNTAGKNKLTNTVQATVDKAVYNGSISIGKTLNLKQKAYITNLTNDEQAWQQVQNLGYWFVTDVEEFTGLDGLTEFKGVYTLIYSKDDAIRKVEGNNILI